MNRIPTLDGLRGLAILLVLAGHTVTNSSAALADARRWWECLANPGMGVRLFFALSGYLITTLLLREQETRGSVELGGFYRRRARRILPAFYVFLFLLAIWIHLDAEATRLPLSAWFSTAAFAWNYSFLWTDHGVAGLWNLAHTWSLALEVQFYLLWPLVLIRLGPRRALHVCLALLGLAPLIRLGIYFFLPQQRGLLGMMLHTSYDGVIAGSAAALLVRWPSVTAHLRRYASPGACLALGWIFLLGPLANFGIRGFSILVGFSLDALAAAWLVSSLHLHPPAWANRLLGEGVMPALGLISYSLYLWQQPFLSRDRWLGDGWVFLPLVAAIAMATVSYFFVERPFLSHRRPGPPRLPSAAPQT